MDDEVEREMRRLSLLATNNYPSQRTTSRDEVEEKMRRISMELKTENKYKERKNAYDFSPKTTDKAEEDMRELSVKPKTYIPFEARPNDDEVEREMRRLSLLIGNNNSNQVITSRDEVEEEMRRISMELKTEENDKEAKNAFDFAPKTTDKAEEDRRELSVNQNTNIPVEAGPMDDEVEREMRRLSLLATNNYPNQVITSRDEVEEEMRRLSMEFKTEKNYKQGKNTYDFTPKTTDKAEKAMRELSLQKSTNIPARARTMDDEVEREMRRLSLLAGSSNPYQSTTGKSRGTSTETDDAKPEEEVRKLSFKQSTDTPFEARPMDDEVEREMRRLSLPTRNNHLNQRTTSRDEVEEEMRQLSMELKTENKYKEAKNAYDFSPKTTDKAEEDMRELSLQKSTDKPFEAGPNDDEVQAEMRRLSLPIRNNNPNQRTTSRDEVEEEMRRLSIEFKTEKNYKEAKNSYDYSPKTTDKAEEDMRELSSKQSTDTPDEERLMDDEVEREMKRLPLLAGNSNQYQAATGTSGETSMNTDDTKPEEEIIQLPFKQSTDTPDEERLMDDEVERKMGHLSLPTRNNCPNQSATGKSGETSMNTNDTKPEEEIIQLPLKQSADTSVEARPMDDEVKREMRHLSLPTRNNSPNQVTTEKSGETSMKINEPKPIVQEVAQETEQYSQLIFDDAEKELYLIETRGLNKNNHTTELSSSFQRESFTDVIAVNKKNSIRELNVEYNTAGTSIEPLLAFKDHDGDVTETQSGIKLDYQRVAISAHVADMESQIPVTSDKDVRLGADDFDKSNGNSEGQTTLMSRTVKKCILKVLRATLLLIILGGGGGFIWFLTNRANSGDGENIDNSLTWRNETQIDTEEEPNVGDMDGNASFVPSAPPSLSPLYSPTPTMTDTNPNSHENNTISEYYQIGASIRGYTDSTGFGSSISLSSSGNRFIVAASASIENTQSTPAAVQVYQLSSDPSDMWEQIGSDLNVTSSSSLSPSFPLFHKVCLSGDGTRVAVSTTTKNSRLGYVKVFRQNENTPGEWVQIGKDIILSDFQFNDTDMEISYSQAISLSYDGKRLAIGAVYANFNYTGGKASVYELMEEQEDWKEIGSVIENEERKRRDFGYSLALSDNGKMIAIGAPNKGKIGNAGITNNNGTVEVYKYLGNNTWVIVTSLLGEQENEEFGHALSFRDEYLAVGAQRYSNNNGVQNVGRVAVFSLAGEEFVPYGASVEGEAEGDNFGYALDISKDGQVLVIGLPGIDAVDGTSAGGASVLQYNDEKGMWDQFGPYITGIPGDDTGYAVSTCWDGFISIVGTPMIDNDERGSVIAYRFPSLEQEGVPVDGGGGVNRNTN